VTIYEVTCLIDGRRYIGSTGQHFTARWREHLSAAANRRNEVPLYQAIRRYGSANFTCREIASALMPGALRFLERKIIEQENTAWPLGLNADHKSLGLGKDTPVKKWRLFQIASDQGLDAAIMAVEQVRHANERECFRWKLSRAFQRL
jgi:hypothetical protein